MRTIDWDREDRLVKMIDQRRLPGELVIFSAHTCEEMVWAIQQMVIRGAPALGVAGALGVALAAQHLAEQKHPSWLAELRTKAALLTQARPTAVNLGWGVARVMRVAETQSKDARQAAQAILQEALAMAEEDVATNLRLAQHGASLIHDGDVLIHHCNTGALAGVDWGTALGAIRYAHESGKHIRVLVDETRPRLQGARLTAWECEQYGIPYQIITDNAAGYFLLRGEVNAVFFGADRVAANGDVVNKVGTYMLSLAAHANHVPVYSVFPKTSLDLSIPDGRSVAIEEREMEEVLALEFKGERVAPQTAQARNPAFDITPHDLISAWVTEDGVIYPPFSEKFPQSVYNLK
jgi:methylthioribose-1-phosphate isomerase